MEKVMIEITEEELEEIMQYSERCECETVQEAIMKAVRNG